ncbi:MAG: hypothetical protein HQ464_10395 [Planctomycetes bacterium]|nr:hypothetical protein [Planctomycetota bacterium]
MQAMRSVGCVVAILFFAIVAPSVACAESEPLRLGIFDVDATPPVGMAMAYGPAARPADLQLRCRGIVILGAAEPIVLCAIDWIGVGNAAHDAFREAPRRQRQRHRIALLSRQFISTTHRTPTSRRRASLLQRRLRPIAGLTADLPGR